MPGYRAVMSNIRSVAPSGDLKLLPVLLRNSRTSKPYEKRRCNTDRKPIPSYRMVMSQSRSVGRWCCMFRDRIASGLLSKCQNVNCNGQETSMELLQKMDALPPTSDVRFGFLRHIAAETTFRPSSERRKSQKITRYTRNFHIFISMPPSIRYCFRSSFAVV
jgi:hypothetical protein